jgi:integrase
MADHCDASLLGVRDRAILLFGFAGAFRRSELVRVEIEHLEETADGIRIHIPRSKSDQEGQGQDIGVMRTGTAYCPVQALQLWLQAAAIKEGLVFRGVDRHGNVGASLSDKAVGLIVKRRADDAGLDPSLFSGHSLRAGLATSAAAAGLEERDIQRQTRHQSVEQLRRYVRPASVFQNNVTKGVGL